MVGKKITKKWRLATQNGLVAVENTISDTSDLAKKTDLNAKSTEVENKMPNITGLAINSPLTAVENKIPDVSNLAKKTDYNTKISEIDKNISDHNHDKLITTPEFNTLAARAFNARLAQADIVKKTDFDAKLQSLNKKINSNKTKHLLVKTEFKKRKDLMEPILEAKNILMAMNTKLFSI